MIRTLSGKQTSFLKAVGRGDPADGFFLRRAAGRYPFPVKDRLFETQYERSFIF